MTQFFFFFLNQVSKDQIAKWKTWGKRDLEVIWALWLTFKGLTTCELTAESPKEPDPYFPSLYSSFFSSSSRFSNSVSTTVRGPICYICYIERSTTKLRPTYKKFKATRRGMRPKELLDSEQYCSRQCELQIVISGNSDLRSEWFNLMNVVLRVKFYFLPVSTNGSPLFTLVSQKTEWCSQWTMQLIWSLSSPAIFSAFWGEKWV